MTEPLPKKSCQYSEVKLCICNYIDFCCYLALTLHFGALCCLVVPIALRELLDVIKVKKYLLQSLSKGPKSCRIGRRIMEFYQLPSLRAAPPGVPWCWGMQKSATVGLCKKRIQWGLFALKICTSFSHAASFQAPYATFWWIQAFSYSVHQVSCSDATKGLCCSPEHARYSYTFVHLDPRCKTPQGQCSGPAPRADYICIFIPHPDYRWSWTCCFYVELLPLSVTVPLSLFSVWCRAN